MVNLKNLSKFRKSKYLAEQFYAQACLCCGRAPKWVFPSVYFAPQKKPNQTNNQTKKTTKTNNKNQLVSPSRGRLEKTISFELRHWPDCSEVKNIMYEGRWMDSISYPSFYFHLQQRKVLVNLSWSGTLSGIM